MGSRIINISMWLQGLSIFQCDPKDHQYFSVAQELSIFGQYFNVTLKAINMYINILILIRLEVTLTYW